MSRLFESLEGRTLFAASINPTVQTDYNNVVNDAGVLKAIVVAAAKTLNADAKAIAADIKSLGKSKTNTADVNAVKKTLAAALKTDKADAGKVVSIGSAALKRAKSAFLADVAKPTTAHLTKLNAALNTLGSILAPLEGTLATDVGTGNTAVAAALNVLVADNPTDASLSTHVTGAETDQSSAADQIAGSVTSLNADINALIAEVTS